MNVESDAKEKPARRACPFCGERLAVGFGDFLPTRGRRGPVLVTCTNCRGQARLASIAQVMGVVGFVLGLLGGAVLGARLAAGQSEQMTLIILGLAVAGGFFLSFTLGYAFLRFDPETDPPAKKPRDARGAQGKKRRKN